MLNEPLSADDLYVLLHIAKQYRREGAFRAHSGLSLIAMFQRLNVYVEPVGALKRLAKAGLLVANDDGGYTLSEEGVSAATGASAT